MLEVIFQICDILIMLSLICILIKCFEASTFHTFLCLAFLQFAAIGLYSDELFEILWLSKNGAITILCREFIVYGNASRNRKYA